MRAVKPIFVRYTYGTMSQSYDIVPYVPLCLMNLCLFDFCFEVVELPPFMPNEYLLRNHADKIKNPEGALGEIKIETAVEHSKINAQFNEGGAGPGISENELEPLSHRKFIEEEQMNMLGRRSGEDKNVALDTVA